MPRWAPLAEDFATSRREAPAYSSTKNRMHLGTLGRRQPLRRGLPRRRADRVGDAALRLARHRQRDRPATSSSWREGGHANLIVNLPDQDLAYLPEGTEHFDDYVEAVDWAQDFARDNRDVMMEAVLRGCAR